MKDINDYFTTNRLTSSGWYTFMTHLHYAASALRDAQHLRDEMRRDSSRAYDDATVLAWQAEWKGICRRVDSAFAEMLKAERENRRLPPLDPPDDLVMIEKRKGKRQ